MKTRAKHYRTTIGFTLVELLVTLTVISVLTGLILPALAGAKRRGESAKCIGNLHQLFIAVRLYSDDNAGHLPDPNFQVSSGAQQTTIRDILISYVGGAINAFRCPSDIARAGNTNAFDSFGTSYNWNSSINGRLFYTVGNEPTARNGLKIFVFRDQEGWHPKGKNAAFLDGYCGSDRL